MKTVGDLNNILRRELGERDHAHAWMRMNDERLLIPMQKMRFVDGRSEPVYDWICVCGKNVRVHRHDCRITQPQSQWFMKPLLPPDKDRYCLARSFQIEPRQWTSIFPALPFPPTGRLWVPYSNNLGLFLLERGLTPTLEDTTLAIAAIREGRATTVNGLQAYLSDTEEQKKKESFDQLYAEIREEFGISTEPGKKRETSFASVN